MGANLTFPPIVSGELATIRPNIVFLMTDDQHARTLGTLGNPRIQTPSLDLLSQKGVVFERCYATSPLCMATRATVMTGMYEYKTGCNFLTGNLGLKAGRR